MRPFPHLACLASAVACVLSPVGLSAQYPLTQPPTGQAPLPSSLTLEDALTEARAANAQLPVAALGVDIARTSVHEIQASRFPRFGLVGGLNLGGPLAYTTSQGAVQAVANETLFSGGLRRAALSAANYRVSGAASFYRMAQKDVDLAVRFRFSEFIRADEEIAFRTQGIDRLTSYLSHVQQRQAAGEPVGSDVLTTQVRLGTEQAALEGARQALDEARLQLNELLGREPNDSLTLAPLPPPAPLPVATEADWRAAPEVAEAEANSGAAQAGIQATRSERRPQLEVSANLGALPTIGKDAGTGPNSGTGFGGAVLFSLSWSLWDAGIYRARLERANMQAEQARDSELVVKRQVQLSYQLASAQLERLYLQVETWARNVPIARDAYLQTQSIYNGGAASALEVLDAFAFWINSNESYADAVLRYRQAEANYLRWGTP